MSEFLSSAPLSFDPAALRKQLGLTEEEMIDLLTGDPLASLTRQVMLSSLLETSPPDRLRTLLSTPPLSGKPLPDAASETVSAFLSGSPLPEPELCSLFTSAMTRLRDPEAGSAPTPEEMLADSRDVFVEKTGLPLSVLSRIAASQPDADVYPELALLTASALLANLLH